MVRENRIPVLFSDEEVAAIDAYQQTNGIATRAKAIRSLISAALSTPTDLPSKMAGTIERCIQDEVQRRLGEIGDYLASHGADQQQRLKGSRHESS